MEIKPFRLRCMAYLPMRLRQDRDTARLGREPVYAPAGRRRVRPSPALRTLVQIITGADQDGQAIGHDPFESMVYWPKIIQAAVLIGLGQSFTYSMPVLYLC